MSFDNVHSNLLNFRTLTAIFHRNFTRGIVDDLNVSFSYRIVNFPADLQKDCVTEFRVGFDSDPTPTVYMKTSFQSSFDSDRFDVGKTKTSFTANLVITKKCSTCWLDASRKSLLDSISRLYLDEKTSDLTIIVKNKRFKVHTLILGASSAVMHTMFTECKDNEITECEIDGIEAHIFEALLRFLYRCEVPDNLKDIAHELYAVAYYYRIGPLRKICLEEVNKNLSSESAVKSYAMAYKYNLKELTVNAWKFLKR